MYWRAEKKSQVQTLSRSTNFNDLKPNKSYSLLTCCSAIFDSIIWNKALISATACPCKRHFHVDGCYHGSCTSRADWQRFENLHSSNRLFSLSHKGFPEIPPEAQKELPVLVMLVESFVQTVNMVNVLLYFHTLNYTMILLWSVSVQ